MNQPSAQRSRLIGLAIGAALGGTLLVTAAARLGFHQPPSQAPVIASAWLAFIDLPDGGVAVRDARTQALIANIPARDDGFLRMTLRLLGAARARQQVAPTAPQARAPFLLTESSAGMMQLSDPATGQRIELEAFGPSNIAEFSRLLGRTS